MPTQSTRRATLQFVGLIQRFHWDMAHAATREDHVPEAWREVWQERSAKKRKISLYVDEDVYKLFKSMGAGMGPRMNTVLGAFARARLAGMLEGDDLIEEYRETWMGKPKPQVREIIAEYEAKVARLNKGAASSGSEGA